MRVIFLDFDGVVNIPLWECKDGKYKCDFGWPKDGKVNHWQGVQWVSEFCQLFGYSIVISSTWRSEGLERCRRYLVNGGLRDGIEVIGITPRSENGHRGTEIKMWLDKHPEVTGFLIFDDDSDMEPYTDRLVKCRYDAGFLEDEMIRARMLHEAFNKE